MSSFLVSHTSIRAIVTHIMSQPNLCQYLPRVLQDAEKLGEAMTSVNERAYSARYSHEKVSHETYVHRETCINRMAVFKSLRCWLYQSSVDHVAQSLVVKTLRKVSSAMAIGIVEDSPEYSAEAWD
jgi:hypothetical protein